MHHAHAALEFVTSERFHELDWDEDGAVTFKEFLFAFVHWVGTRVYTHRCAHVNMGQGGGPPWQSIVLNTQAACAYPSCSVTPSIVTFAFSLCLTRGAECMQVGIDDTDEDNEAAEAERQRLHPHQHQHHHHAAHGHGHSHGSSGGAGSSPSATFHDGSAAAAAAHEAAGGRKHAHGGSSNPFASLMAAMTSKHGHAAAAGGHHATAAAVAEAQ